MKQIKIYAEILEDEALKQFNEAMSLGCNIQGALMPDAHTGYTLPIGAVIKSDGMVFPSYVGYDIGCGVCAAILDVRADTVNFEALKSHILANIPIGFDKLKEKKEIDLELPCTDFAKKQLQDVGVWQLGTLGNGNHFIEVGKNNDGFVSIVIHSGSRGFGHKIATHYMQAAYDVNNKVDFDESGAIAEFTEKNKLWAGKNPDGFQKALQKHIDGVKAKETTKPKDIEGHFGFNINSQIGKEYLMDMDYALSFALLNRVEMINKIVSFFGGATISTFINRNHNHAELKDGFVIHRKGATHAEKGMMGVIPGNMRDGSFIVRGLGNEEAICSSSHGAGRVLSRAQAKKKVSLEDMQSEMKGIVNNHNADVIDEAPSAYKNIFEVMELQKDLVEVIDRVIPLLNIKG